MVDSRVGNSVVLLVASKAFSLAVNLVALLVEWRAEYLVFLQVDYLAEK